MYIYICILLPVLLLITSCGEQPSITNPSPKPSPTSTTFEPPADNPAPKRTISKECRFNCRGGN